MNKISISIPSGDIGFVENKRSFVVQGRFDKPIENDCEVKVCLYDNEHHLVRYAKSNHSNPSIFSYHPDLTCYEEQLDPGRIKMEEFGFPELIVEDINNPNDSLYRATIKCFYNEHIFKAIIVNATKSIFDDGLNLLDDNSNEYELLKMGDYLIEVSVLKGDEIIGFGSKKMIIGKRDNQLICRYNPVEHKKAIIAWSKENNFSAIEDLLPGYLDPYLGTWYYHMGLLKMYRANDVCLYDDVNVRMFVYLMDESSTSYATELAYLQSQNKVKDANSFFAYHYDIGEAKVNDREGKIVEFKDNQYLSLCRIDIVNHSCKENVYYLDGSNTIESLFDLNNITVSKNSKIAIMGVVKPWQMNPNDFILKDDNTYQILNFPKTIRYKYSLENKDIIESHSLNMERIDSVSIGKSVFEFYNILTIGDKDIELTIELIDNKDNKIDERFIKIKVC